MRASEVQDGSLKDEDIGERAVVDAYVSIGGVDAQECNYVTLPAGVDVSGDHLVLTPDLNTASPNLIKLARGADVLIHEVIHFGYLEWLGQSLVQQGGSPERLIRHLTAAHTSDRSVAKTGTRPAITGVGTVARRAGVRRLVLNHLVPTADLSRDGRWFDIPAREWHRHPARAPGAGGHG